MPSLTLSPDLTLNYLDINPRGTQTVLLLHGLGATGGSWELQIPSLVESGYRVLAPDLRGFGQSSYPGQTGIDEMARDAAALLAAVADGPVDVVGISMGGAVALHLALDHAAAVRALVLVNTGACFRPRYLVGWLAHALRYAVLYMLTSQAQARLVARRTFPQPHQEDLRRALAGQILQANQYAYRASLRALACFDVSSRLGEIRLPTLVVSGARDGTIPLAHQRLLAEKIPEARHAVLPEAGHGAIADCPEDFNRVLLDFIGTNQTVPARFTL